MSSAIDKVLNFLFDLAFPHPPENIQYCSECGGTGYDRLWRLCEHCHGIGFVEVKKE